MSSTLNDCSCTEDRWRDLSSDYAYIDSGKIFGGLEQGAYINHKTQI